MPQKFIHAADIHLDSPIAGLKGVDGTSAAKLQVATRNSFERIITLALEQRVEALLISGDLFDRPVEDAGTALWADSQMRRLSSEGIPVLLIRGNHDANSQARNAIDWADGIHEFGTAQAGTEIIESANLAVHGQSFGARAELNDLAANYPLAVDGYFNVGLLHTSLSGNSQHDTYAPTSASVLEGKGYQYWALGHIHRRTQESLSDRCYIGYCGNAQGRHIREPGAHGCNLVEYDGSSLLGVQFVATDSLRWEELEVNVSPFSKLGDVCEAIESTATEYYQRNLAWLSESDDRAFAVRVRLSGSTKLHATLLQPNSSERITELAVERFDSLDRLWLEKVKIATTPADDSHPLDLDLPIKYLSLVVEEMKESHSSQIEIREVLEELLKKTRRDLGAVAFPLLHENTEAEQLDAYIEEAEKLVMSRLTNQL